MAWFLLIPIVAALGYTAGKAKAERERYNSPKE